VALLGGTTSLTDCLAAASFTLRPHRLTEGRWLREYEQAFAGYIGARFGYSFSSGRVALFGILKALGVGDGDEIIVQVPTHIVVANAVRYTGARPVFVDSTVSTCNIDVAAMEKAATDRTKAIVVQHTFGIPADLGVVARVANAHGIPIIEDCVHALGARYNGARVGSIGRAAFFSTEETKTISTTMGGMAVTSDAVLAKRLEEFQQGCAYPPRWLTVRYLAKLVAYHLLTEPHLHRYTRGLYEALAGRNPFPGPTTAAEIRGSRPPGYERRLSNAQALLGLRQLERIDQNLAHREKIALAFTSRLRALGFEMPHPPPGATPAYVRVPVYVNARRAAVAAAARHGILGTWFTSVLEESLDPGVAGYAAGCCPVAEQLAERLVNLPTHGRVSLRDIEPIVTALAVAEKRYLGGHVVDHESPVRMAFGR
jgi:dTDP-4-amino-4,6-dideoxygalactose transaminase